MGGAPHYGKSPVEDLLVLTEALPEWAVEEYATGSGPITVPGVHVGEDGTAYGSVSHQSREAGEWPEDEVDEYAARVRSAFGGDGAGTPPSGTPMVTGASVTVDNNLQPAHPNCRSSTVPMDTEISMSVDVEVDPEDMDKLRRILGNSVDEAAEEALERAKRRTPNVR